MKAIRKTDQGGSVASFIFIGVMLAVMLIGTIYFVKQRGEQVRRDQAIVKYDKEQAEKKAEEAKRLAESKKSTANSSEPAEVAGVSTELPNTGPSSSFVQLIGVFLLTATSISYFSSKRYIPRSL